MAVLLTGAGIVGTAQARPLARVEAGPLSWSSSWTANHPDVGNASLRSTASAGGATVAVGRTEWSPDGKEGMSAPLAVHMENGSWKKRELPVPAGAQGQMEDVAVIGAADAWTAGNVGNAPYLAHWDGATWTQAPAPAEHRFGTYLGVSASGPDDVWVVGTGSETETVNEPNRVLLARYDGKAWHTVPLPADAAGPDGWDRNWMSGISVLGPNDVWIAGTGHATVHWDGRKWTHVPVPLAGDAEIWFERVRSHPVHGTWAVGYALTPGKPRTPVALRWNGRAWERAELPEDDWAQLLDITFTARGPLGVGYRNNRETGTHTGYGLLLPTWPGGRAKHLTLPGDSFLFSSATTGPGGVGLWVVGVRAGESWLLDPFAATVPLPPTY
ncbi:hypothetical protein [Streptomyces sp. NPDC059072]|uniref:hypothetical protein n=1 Tax=Streptomyces sp. NPDC059072 TaxID=3346715 RepID=UPI00368C5CCC